MAKARPSKKRKGPNPFVSLLMFVALGAVVYSQWDRLVPFVRGALGMYGGDEEGVLDADWRRIAATGKTAVARYLIAKGRAPSSNEEVGLEDAASYHAGALRSMDIDPGGKIIFEFGKSPSGPPGRVVLTPDTSQVLQDVVKWDCTTSSYKNLAACTYVPPN
jgi:hypothetical protein